MLALADALETRRLPLVQHAGAVALPLRYNHGKGREV
jgi:hypothetical protein